MQKRQALTWYVILQIIVLLCFYFPFLFGAQDFFFRDVTHYEEPFCSFIATGIKQMRLPLWNPWTYCGMSQAAISVHGYFYPPTWLFAAMPFSPAVALTMILHQTLCGLGGFLLVTSMGWGLAGATICGIALAMSGYMFSLVPNFTLVSTAAWVPLSIWAVRSLSLRVIAGAPMSALVMRTALVALSIGMLILTGQPELGTVALGVTGFMVVMAAAELSRANNPLWKQIIVFQTRAIGLGVLLAMPAILPACEWLQLSRRSGGLLSAETLLLSANWYDLLNFVLPQPLGDLQLRYAGLRQLVMDGAMVPYVTAPFIGPFVLTFALVALTDKTFKQRFLFLLAAIVVLLLALGANAPLAPALLNLFPSLSFIRFPIKLTFFLILILAILSAKGLSAALNRSADVTLAASFWIVFIGVALLQLLGANYVDLIFSGRSMPLPLRELSYDAQALIARSAVLWGFGGSVTCAAIVLAGRNKFQTRWLAVAAIALSVAAQLYLAFAFCHRGAAPGFFTSPSYIESRLKQLFEKNKDQAPRHLGLFLERFSVPHKIAGLDPLSATINMYQYSRQMLRPNTNMDAWQPSSFGFEGTCTSDFHYFLVNSYLKSSQAFDAPTVPRTDDALARFCQVTSTAYVVTQCYRYGNDGKPVPTALLDDKYFEVVETALEMNARIFRLRQTLPRAYFCPTLKMIKSRDAAIEEMFSPEKSGFDPLKYTLLENAPEILSLDAQPPVDKTITHQSVAVVSDTLNEVELQVETPTQTIVVLTDQMYPGWMAEADGKPVPVIAANCFTRAVLVQPGKHQIRFAYRPLSVGAGIALSLLALAWLFYLNWLSKRQLHFDRDGNAS